MTEAIEIYCDEAGYTGTSLLDPEQLYFAFSSVALTNKEAEEIISNARSQHPVQLPELKAAKLLRTARGRLLIQDILTRIEGRYAVVVHDKVMALCAHFFEYVYEPMFKERPWILYEKKLHVTITMVLYAWFRVRDGDAAQALAELQAYLQSLDPNTAPLLFGQVVPSESLERDPLNWILRFARACRREINADNAEIRTSLPEGSKWLGDLGTTSLFTHLNFWGAKGLGLAVTCDASKPLNANVINLTGDDRDAGIVRAKSQSYSGPLGWRLHRPISFGDSKTQPALQIADIVAGAAAYAVRKDLPESAELAEIRGTLQRHVLLHCILPDFSMIDRGNRASVVNMSMLYRLTQKAEEGRNLYLGLEQDYQFAEIAADAGRI